MIKTKIVNYQEKMNKHFFCVFRKFIDNNDLNNIINKIKFYETRYELDEGGNDYISNEKRKINCLYSDFGDELKRMKNWSETIREEMLDKYHHIKNDLGRDLNKILHNIFYLLRCKQWKILMVTKFDVYPGCIEQEIHMDMPGYLPDNEVRYYISIPLHNTNKNMGPIIFYDETGMSEFRKKHNYDKENPKGSVVGFLNDLNWETKQVFLGSRFQCDYEFGDVSIHRDITYHSGGTNNTNRVRQFLFIACAARY